MNVIIQVKYGEQNTGFNKMRKNQPNDFELFELLRKPGTFFRVIISGFKVLIRFFVAY